jgi:sigma-B regulation protein RsbU (phosphoserine phosphatase)
MTLATAVSFTLVAASLTAVAWAVFRARQRWHGSMPPLGRETAHVPTKAPDDSARPVDQNEQQLGGLYRSVFQSIADALVVIDDHGLIRSFSPSAERTFGYKSKEVVGRNVSLLMPKPDRELHDEYMRRYVDSGWASGRMEQLLLTGDAHIIRPGRETVATRKDGTTFPVRLIVSEVESGGSRMFVGLISDVSERKRLEKELAAQVASRDVLLRQLQEAYAVIEGQRQRMQGELDVGREIQLSMVPRRFPRMPEFDLYATLLPAREVGGDFYDFFMTPAGQLWMCVGDVSGKGVPAALLMAVTKTLVKSSASRGVSPAVVLTEVNAELSRENDTAMFVSAFVACLDSNTGVLRYANAGHNPPLLHRGHAGVQRLAERHGPVLGALESVTYTESVTRLATDDVLLLYTDGVTEALDLGQQLFSESRLTNALMAASNLPVETVTEKVVCAVQEFARDVEQADDITVLTLRYRGSRTSQPELHFRLRVPNRLEALPGVLDDVERLVERCGGTVATRHRFAVAFDELLSNIIKYAHPDGSQRMIDCAIVKRDGAISAVIADDGLPFNPLDLPAPDTELPLDVREIGGLGVHIVRRMFTAIHYKRRASQNVTTIVHRDPSV